MFRYVIDGYSVEDVRSIKAVLNNALVSKRGVRVMLSFTSEHLMQCDEIVKTVSSAGVEPIRIIASEVVYGGTLHSERVEKLITLLNTLSGYPPNERVVRIVYTCSPR